MIPGFLRPVRTRQQKEEHSTRLNPRLSIQAFRARWRMAEKVGNLPNKKRKSLTGLLKIKVNKNELLPWTKNQGPGGNGEIFQTGDDSTPV